MLPIAAAVIALQPLLDHAMSHLHIPETTRVRIEVSDRSPMDTTQYMNTSNKPIAWVQDKRWGYMISVRRSVLEANPPTEKVQWTVFHELCHVVYDWDYIANWGVLSEVARKQREDRAAFCANYLMSRHFKECRRKK